MNERKALTLAALFLMGIIVIMNFIIYKIDIVVEKETGISLWPPVFAVSVTMCFLMTFAFIITREPKLKSKVVK